MRKGFVIILVLATLVLLALLSITYIKLALIDRNIARNYMDNKRAKLIAQSGVDYAIARLQENFFDTSWQEAKLIKINGVDTKYTESAGSTYGENRDVFAVTVKDCNSMINVNDGLNNERVTANTERILKALGDVVGVADLGNKIIDNRPVQGYQSKQELLKFITQDEFNTIKNLVTTHAWQDSDVANPVPLSSEVISAYPVCYNTGLNTALGTINVYRYGRGYDSLGNLIHAPPTKNNPLLFAPDFAAGDSFVHSVFAQDELNPQWLEIVSRSPVNINTAERDILIALLKDLKGFFLSDRRRNCPQYHKSYSLAAGLLTSTSGDWRPTIGYEFDYSPASPKGDELGFLYTTDQINAATIADEIINCRSNTGTYAAKWFGGQFKTWRQFNAFCDNLVEDKVKETRPIFYEYCLVVDPSLDSPTFSEVARRQASQAMADVLKANFNPNLHLNELNPDANIKTLVDKTDLIVNSTEFCFTPMGYFEIESEAMILKGDRVISQSKLEALTKLFDAVRYTNQKQFMGGILEAKAGTNNGYSLEIGPEPGHILDGLGNPIAKANEWSGYIALATVNFPKFPYSTFESRFSTTFKADYHQDGLRDNITQYNVADRTESGVKGPYTYSLNNRLARSFRRESEINTLRAPCDLRIDGAYVERHAGLAYNASTSIFLDSGMFMYWIKPSFYPETTGKPRTFFSLNKANIRTFWSNQKADSSIIFANFFLASQWPDNQLAYEDNTTLAYGGGFLGSGTDTSGDVRCYRATSLIFGYNADDSGGFGHSTPILNHLSHFDPLTGEPRACYPLGSAPKANYLKSGQWIHVACQWNLTSSSPTSKSDKYCQIWINGAKHINSAIHWTTHGGQIYPAYPMSKYTVTGRFRIGEALNDTAGDYFRKWTCDATIDEFYIFSWIPLENMYSRGRYCKSGETSYISRTLKLANDKNAPSNSIIVSPSAFGSEGTVSTPKIKILGLSWTYYGEGVDAQGNPIIKNYKDYERYNEPSVNLAIKMKVSILKNYNTSTGTPEAEYIPLDQKDGYSFLAVEIAPGANYRYKTIFKIEYDPSNPDKNPDNAVLLYSPIFDDITIYYTQGPIFLSYKTSD